MACRLFGAKPLSKPMLGYCQLNLLKNKLQLNLNENTKLFIQENASKNIICETVAILSGGDELKQMLQDLIMDRTFFILIYT